MRIVSLIQEKINEGNKDFDNKVEVKYFIKIINRTGNPKWDLVLSNIKDILQYIEGNK
ncbi:DUF3970 family protein [Cytobacillus praedii]|uniref:DUF3970 family protein n=1 Tax=Cytobacillus praedii TaxID=1742358 RepID=UPI003F7FE92A